MYRLIIAAGIASIVAAHEGATPVGSTWFPSDTTVTIIHDPGTRTSPAPRAPGNLLDFATMCPPEVIGCGQNVTGTTTTYQETIYITRKSTITEPNTVTETHKHVTVSVSTSYNTTQGICSTATHVVVPEPIVITVEQNVTATSYYVTRETTTVTSLSIVNATSQIPCIVSSETPIPVLPPTKLPGSGSPTPKEDEASFTIMRNSDEPLPTPIEGEAQAFLSNDGVEELDGDDD